MAKPNPSKLYNPSLYNLLIPKQPPISTPSTFLNHNTHQDRLETERLQSIQTLINLNQTHHSKTLIETLLNSNTSFASPVYLFRTLSVSVPVPTVDLVLLNLIFSACVTSDEKLSVLRLMMENGVLPSLALLNNFLETLCEVGRFGDALCLFQEVVKFGVVFDGFAFDKAVEAAMKIGDMEKAVELMVRMLRNGYKLERDMCKGVMLELCEEGKVDMAASLFEEMCERRMSVDRESHCCLITGYCRAGKLEKALWVREVMRYRCICPDVDTFNLLVKELCRRKMVKEAQDVLMDMYMRSLDHPTGFGRSFWEDEGSRSCDRDNPNHKHKHILVNGHYEAGKVNEAVKNHKDLRKFSRTWMYVVELVKSKWR